MGRLNSTEFVGKSIGIQRNSPRCWVFSGRRGTRGGGHGVRQGKKAFRGDELPERRLFWEHQGNAAAMIGNWKAVRPGPDAAWKVFDLSNDRIESKDLVAAQPDRFKELEGAWEQWARRVAADPFSGKPAKKRR